VVYQWAVKEYVQHQRERRWYWVMGILAAALLVYAVIAGNYLFALIIVLFGIILFLHDLLEPMEVGFAITSVGIILGKKFYRYSELKNFWFIYNPPEVKIFILPPAVIPGIACRSRFWIMIRVRSASIWDNF